MGLKWTEVLLILLVIFVIFGCSRLANLGASLGSGIRNFKKGLSGEEETDASAASPSSTLPKTSANAGQEVAQQGAAAKKG